MLKSLHETLEPILSKNYDEDAIWQAYEECKKIIHKFQLDGADIDCWEYSKVIRYVSDRLGV